MKGFLKGLWCAIITFFAHQKIRIRLAKTSDLPEIRRLHAEQYRARGLVTGDVQELDIYPEYDLGRCSNTKTLVAVAEGEIVGTISMTYDYDECMGSPLENEFPEEASLARMGGLSFLTDSFGDPLSDEEIDAQMENDCIVYFWRFAVKHAFRGKVANMLFARAKEIALKSEGVSWVLAIVHPRHVRFYERAGFAVIGEKANTSGLDKAPAVLLCADTDVYVREVNSCAFSAQALRTQIHHGGGLVYQ